MTAVAPALERGGCQSRGVAGLGGEGGFGLQDAQAHGDADTELLATLHLQVPHDAPGEESEDEVHEARVTCLWLA